MVIHLVKARAEAAVIKKQPPKISKEELFKLADELYAFAIEGKPQPFEVAAVMGLPDPMKQKGIVLVINYMNRDIPFFGDAVQVAA